ncbi:MAG: hypothetical protein ABIP45_03040 [Knoellia sp.]
MSDTSENTTGNPAENAAENTGAISRPDDVRDEVKLDLDEDALDTWEEVRDNYVVDPDSEVARPALTESEDDEDDGDDLAVTSEDGEEDDEAEDEDGDHDHGDEEE